MVPPEGYVLCGSSTVMGCTGAKGVRLRKTAAFGRSSSLLSLQVLLYNLRQQKLLEQRIKLSSASLLAVRHLIGVLVATVLQSIAKSLQGNWPLSLVLLPACF
jgi:hypothetical protein